MKKLTLLVAFTMLVFVTFSNGLLTNTNQSAQFIRMMSRNASLGIDGVYYNPAGLTKLEDGWHFSVNSQTIFQNKIIDSKFPWLNDGHYEGSVKVPVFPTGFAVYKKDKLALSFGFGPNAGGGSATFDRGLPSFEIGIAKAAKGLGELGVSGYDADLSFEGRSIFWGFQLGATYAINDMLSLSAGVRYMPANNAYQGSIKNINFKVGNDMVNASQMLTGVAQQANGAAQIFNGAATQMQPLIDMGAGPLTLAQLEGLGYIDASQRAQMEGGLGMLGLTPEQIGGMNVTTIQGTYSAAGVGYAQQAVELEAGADQLQDKEVDTEQSGTGFTPILGLNFSPNENLNIALKYEHKTYLTLTNSTTVDDLGLFPDGAESASDIPAILSLGVGYTDNDWYEVQFSYTMFFDKNVDWGANVRDVAIWKGTDPTQIRAREIDNNGYEIGLGFQYNFTKKFSASIGGLMANNGVADSFQSDFSFSNTSFTLGGGIMWKLTDQLTLDAGLLNVFYQDASVKFADPHVASGYEETYTKEALTFAVGLSYSIFK